MQRYRQKGAALILMFLVLVLLALSSFVVTNIPEQRKAEVDERTHQALKKAKQLLLAYAARPHGRESDSPTETREYQLARPGELQCPDFNNDGVMSGPTDDYSGADCRQRVGWFAFESFDEKEIVSGEVSDIWFAVADGFYNRSGLAGYNEPIINTSSTTSMTLDGNPVVAVLFATGSPYASQVARNSNNASIAQSSFLEQDNADGDNDKFVSHVAGGDFNDTVIGITLSELLAAVEIQAAHAVAKRFNEYYLENGVYPFAADAAGNCDNITMPLNGDVPIACPAVLPSVFDLDFPAATATTVSDVWLVRNEWPAQFRYERMANNRIRISSKSPDSRMRPITYEDAKQLRL